MRYAQIDTLRPRSDHAVLGPESVWLDVLADARLVSWLSLMLTDAVLHTHPSVQSAAYMEEATQFLVHLCSIRSSTFRANAEGLCVVLSCVKASLKVPRSRKHFSNIFYSNFSHSCC